MVKGLVLLYGVMEVLSCSIIAKRGPEVFAACQKRKVSKHKGVAQVARTVKAA